MRLKSLGRGECCVYAVGSTKTVEGERLNSGKISC